MAGEPEVVVSRHYKLRLPLDEDETWSEEGVQSMVGQRVSTPGFTEGKHGQVIAARLLPDGAAEITLRVSSEPL